MSFSLLLLPLWQGKATSTHNVGFSHVPAPPSPPASPKACVTPGVTRSCHLTNVDLRLQSILEWMGARPSNKIICFGDGEQGRTRNMWSHDDTTVCLDHMWSSAGKESREAMPVSPHRVWGSGCVRVTALPSVNSKVNHSPRPTMKCHGGAPGPHGGCWPWGVGTLRWGARRMLCLVLASALAPKLPEDEGCWEAMVRADPALWVRGGAPPCGCVIHDPA